MMKIINHFMKNLLFLLIILSFASSEIISPENNSLFNSIYILFEWEQEPGAVEYNLQISNDEFFNELIVDISLYETLFIEKDNLDWSNNYYWRVRPIYIDGSFGNWINDDIFYIYPNIMQDFETTIYDNNLTEDGLIIYGQFAPDLLIGVIDKDGKKIWNSGSPDIDHQLGTLLNHVSKNGQLFGKSSTAGIEFNYNQDVIWQTPSSTIIDLHEVQQLPNGNYMSFVPIFENGPIVDGWWTDQFRALGYIVDGETNEFPWLGQRIVEWDKNTGEEVWSWNPFEHFNMDERDTGSELWSDAYVSGRFDWLHSNSFYFDENESVIYVSHRHLNRISKTAYPSGDIIWNIGLPENYNMGDNNICTDLLFSWQHHVQLLENGDLLFFDNGNLSEMLLDDENPTSRARRIKVNEDLTCDTIWEYTLPENLFGPGTGSIQLLDNGNYSIYTLGGYVDCSILEVTQEKELVWKAEASDPSSSLYRTYKVPSIHPEAFSVLVNGYTQDFLVPVVELIDTSLVFRITNHSGYTNTYDYSFENIEEGWFENQESSITIEPYETEFIYFSANSSDQDTQISLTIHPRYHQYAQKELNFTVINSQGIIGDINGDLRVNIYDILIIVNMILDLETNQSTADLNLDGGVNILDLSILVNIVLNQ